MSCFRAQSLKRAGCSFVLLFRLCIWFLKYLFERFPLSGAGAVMFLGKNMQRFCSGFAKHLF